MTPFTQILRSDKTKLWLNRSEIGGGGEVQGRRGEWIESRPQPKSHMKGVSQVLKLTNKGRQRRKARKGESSYKLL